MYIFNFMENEHVAGPAFFIGGDEKQYGIDIFQRTVSGFIHKPSQFMFRFVNPRRVEKNNLTVRVRMDAENLIPRRLCLIGNNGHLLPEDPIDKCGLAYVRPAYNRDKARFKFLFHKSPYSEKGCGSSESKAAHV